MIQELEYLKNVFLNYRKNIKHLDKVNAKTKKELGWAYDYVKNYQNILGHNIN